MCILGFALPARAGLGDFSSAIEKDRKGLSARKMSANGRGKFTTQALESDSGKVTEYVSPEGRVFAITWQGLDHPDLSLLLGSYAGAYLESDKNRKLIRGKRKQQHRSSSLVVQKWGGMRNFRGRAFDPKLLPAGVNENEIQ